MYGTESLLVGLSTIPTVAQIVALYLCTFTVHVFDFLRETMTLELLGCYLFLTREFVKTSKELRKNFQSSFEEVSQFL